MLDYSVLPQCVVAAVVVYTACLLLHALLPLPKHSGYAPSHQLARQPRRNSCMAGTADAPRQAAFSSTAWLHFGFGSCPFPCGSMWQTPAMPPLPFFWRRCSCVLNCACARPCSRKHNRYSLVLLFAELDRNERNMFSSFCDDILRRVDHERNACRHL